LSSDNQVDQANDDNEEEQQDGRDDNNNQEYFHSANTLQLFVGGVNIF
jgi:hypothetical protein